MQGQGGQACPIFRKRWDPANTRACRGIVAKNPILRHIRLDDQEIGRAKERGLRGALEDHGRPMSVLLQVMFRHVGRPAVLGGSSQKAGRRHNNNEVFLAPARIQRPQGNQDCHVQISYRAQWRCHHRLPQRL